jgi:hypothetical protein
MRKMRNFLDMPGMLGMLGMLEMLAPPVARHPRSVTVTTGGTAKQ